MFKNYNQDFYVAGGGGICTRTPPTSRMRGPLARRGAGRRFALGAANAQASTGGGGALRTPSVLLAVNVLQTGRPSVRAYRTMAVEQSQVAVEPPPEVRERLSSLNEPITSFFLR